ncbi:hypothetical protein MSZK_02860 [Mycobacterium sp. shizuoka-1]|nr:hypothetical protein MSZK_02860 [Mycobacterium sp. shizuoka-1]
MASGPGGLPVRNAATTAATTYAMPAIPPVRFKPERFIVPPDDLRPGSSVCPARARAAHIAQNPPK